MAHKCSYAEWIFCRSKKNGRCMAYPYGCCSFFEWRSCKSKVRYETMREAAFQRRFLSAKNRSSYHTYFCRFCSGYHNGKPRKKKKGAWWNEQNL